MTGGLQEIGSLPRAVRSEENVWIPMRDGARLAGRLWLPEDAGRHPVPAVLEYIPYRKRDFTRYRDSLMHPYMAGHGYACLRVDLRGSGDSDGVLTDEYLEQELLDGCDVVAWLAAQPWCTGSVGMIGISWGGFNGLQIAALQPPELKAVISLCSTDDRYVDDIHHMGGCLLGDNLSWAAVMFAYNSLPPDPAVVGERWREMWLQRLEGSGLWLETWLRHQRRDAYWRHGSIAEDYAAVRCPVMAVSGWADGYSNAVFRLLAHLEVPRRGLVGPWGHKYPHLGKPGPAIGFLQECVRWWDHWLKGEETGVMAEPMLRVWMQDSVPPSAHYDERPGRWVAEPSWPSDNVVRRRRALAPGRIMPAGVPGEGEALQLQSPLTVGLFAGKWCSYAAGPDLAHDQRQEDGGALVFDSEPLDSAVEILGTATVELDVAADQPLAMVAVRLSDVAPDGKATRVTFGMLNLTHRDSAEHPEVLEPGRRYCVRVRMNDIAQSFPPGHRIRLSVSSSYWPLAWPPPRPVQLTIHPATSAIELPVRAARRDDAALSPFGPPQASPGTPRRVLEASHHNWLVHRDLAADASTLEVINNHGVVLLEETGTEIVNRNLEWYSSHGDDFLSPRGETRLVRGLARGPWRIRTETRTVLTCSANAFHIAADLDAYEGDQRVFCKSWDVAVPRDFN
ncbi:CocE/NonD family hydrolase [Thioalkalivibrio sp. XN8]|uniref:CocE/NonD family hydrolase n=1 Tax=Thioalkalivibrio sp. XN8 TaxID=2712863 RepID=UPI0013EBD900|nr:CocE/NonD family hydrolase [Thioalkalivibrio sp. XN8]NGP52630.1 CocE/NonD family hydrolase [Thioalkalivibrio sp. XN8]